MPTFYTEDLDIDVYEFLYACDEKEIDEIIEYLADEKFIDKPNNVSKLGVMESEFSDKLNNLKNYYYSISSEDLEIIDKLIKKYC